MKKERCKLTEVAFELGEVTGRLQNAGNWPNTSDKLKRISEKLLELRCGDKGCRGND